MKLWIVGLGSGDPDALSVGCYRLLQSGLPTWVRTEQHPVVLWLKEQGIELKSFDFIYERHSSFSEVYKEIVQFLIQQVKEQKEILYAVPGHPLVAEQTVKELLQQAEEAGIEVEIKGSESFLDTAFTRLHIDPIEGFSILNGDNLQVNQLQPNLHQLIGQVYDQQTASEVKLTLMEVYPDDTPITIVDALGVEGQELIQVVSLAELDHWDRFHNLTSLYLPPHTEAWSLTRRFETLVQLFAHLRSPDGCPWDRKQTHQSLRPYLLEEAYEFLSAVEQEDLTSMEEELGDVLLQVLFHAQIASESDEFTIYDVIQTLSEKLIRRHPHVFSSECAETADDVLITWEKVKQSEKGSIPKSILADIPTGMPSLMVAYQIQKKVSKVGFDWENVNDVQEKVMEEWQELLTATTKESQEEEWGDLLFTLVNLARFLHIDPEVALHRVNDKFRERFAFVERSAEQRGLDLTEATLAQLDQWWDQAKQRE
ncbi:tetrapyrrole methylase family protein / MazG family protein [Seinonella peptonophila]|uniref:Tetrapyrrole methylase family protein / MazG family protein n=1 Tax=Seinonella peptonophila TaxID=112248 RepID=A0A1M4YR68_9BACL|nr:nucleoside triphosphate pyrophosphohydrolase [Seinonella peptonophila]SHF08349.1 tetrapyrrole methylase family protein / MazG family protein [Seinonella peptonophila]